MEQKLFKFSETPRGFYCLSFRDLFNAECSLQESSLATERAIWLGVDEHKRMHLNQAQAKSLIEELQFFVDNGALRSNSPNAEGN